MGTGLLVKIYPSSAFRIDDVREKRYDVGSGAMEMFWKPTGGWSQQRAEGEMMKPTLWLLLFLFLLTGCAITYTHPTKSAKDFEKDQRECELIAKKALVAKGIPNT